METTQKVYTVEKLHEDIEKILLKYTEHPIYGKIRLTEISGSLAVVRSCRKGDNDKYRLAVYLGDVFICPELTHPVFAGMQCLLFLDQNELTTGMESTGLLIPIQYMKQYMKGPGISLKDEFSFTWEDVRNQMKKIVE
jgi:hypothetical protein